MINRVGNLKLFRWSAGSPTLSLTVPGYSRRAPKLRYGWSVFFVAHFGQDRTVYSYRRTEKVPA